MRTYQAFFHAIRITHTGMANEMTKESGEIKELARTMGATHKKAK
jgi:hypothetical protein